VNKTLLLGPQIEMHTAEPFVPQPSLIEVQFAVAKMEKYKSPSSDQIPAELIEAGGGALWSEIHKRVNCIWNEEELPERWKGCFIVPI
jgi:hypothetical protein